MVQTSSTDLTVSQCIHSPFQPWIIFSILTAVATLQEAQQAAASQALEQGMLSSGKQRRDSSPAQLAFSSQLPLSSSQVLLATTCSPPLPHCGSPPCMHVSSALRPALGSITLCSMVLTRGAFSGGLDSCCVKETAAWHLQDVMLGQDRDQDIPRLRSFTGPGAADEGFSKASKKKRDPSPLSRMGSSLLRPFKGLSKLRTSRSSDKDNKLQGGQPRVASHTESLASRGTSASTQDAAGPSRYNSASLQTQAQSMQSGRPASDSFQFRRRTATEDAPDLAAEPSFAQDLPQNRRSGQAGLQPAVLTSKTAPLTTSGGFARPGQPSSSSSGDMQPKASPSAADTPAANADSDDEFDYDLSHPAAAAAAPQRTTAAQATLLQPKVTSTSPLQAESTSSDAAAVNSGSASSSPQAVSMTDSSSAGGRGSSALTAGTASQQSPAGFSVEPGRFRPQRSRGERPLVTPATASVYSPLQAGAATSPTMRGEPHKDSMGGTTPPAEAQAGLLTQAGPTPAAGGVQQGSKHEQGARTEGSHQGTGSASKGSEAQASTAKTPELPGVGLSQKKSEPGLGSLDTPGSHAAEPADSHRGPVTGAPTGHGFLDNDDSTSPSLSPASSAASSEFDILEAMPDLPQPLSVPNSPAQTHTDPHMVQRSAYSDTPILAPSMQRQPGNTAFVTSASASGRSSDTMLSHRDILGNTVPQPSLGSTQPVSSPGVLAGASGAAALPAVHRRGFSDKPILAVYSRRPSADGEASEAEGSGSQALQTKVAYNGPCLVAIQLPCRSSWKVCTCEHVSCCCLKASFVGWPKLVISFVFFSAW